MKDALTPELPSAQGLVHLTGPVIPDILSMKDALIPDLPSAQGLVYLDGLVSPAILSSIIGCNVSLVYQEVQAGRLPNPLIEHTYRDCLQMYIKHFKKSQDLKIVKEKNAHDITVAKLEEAAKLKQMKVSAGSSRSFGGSEGEDGSAMPPLMAAKYKQDIRLGIARETSLWIKASIERGEYISLPELVEIVEPFIMTIRQTLLSLSLTDPEMEKQVDMVMGTLHTLGERLVYDATSDNDKFIASIMAKEVIPEEIEIDNEPPRLL